MGEGPGRTGTPSDPGPQPFGRKAETSVRPSLAARAHATDAVRAFLCNAAAGERPGSPGGTWPTDA